MGPLGYYVRVMFKAIKTTASFTDTKTSTAAFGLFVVGTGLVFAWLNTGPEESFAKAKDWFDGVKTALIVAAIVFACCLVYAPYQIFCEDREGFDKIAKAAESAAAARHEELMSKFDSLTVQKDDSERARSALQAEKDATPATPADAMEVFRVLSEKTSNRLGDPAAIAEPGEWLAAIRRIVELTLRTSFVQDLDRHIKSAGNSGRDMFGACIGWLNDWGHRLGINHVRPECTRTELRAAMEQLETK